jgi:hypothetical protein
MRSRFRIKWDANDLILIGSSLDYLENNPKVLRRYRMAARLPLLILGAPGGWALRPTAAFYAATMTSFLLAIQGGHLGQLSILTSVMVAVIISHSYGTLRDTSGSLIRLQVLRILRAPRTEWAQFFSGYALSYLDSVSRYTVKPGRIKRYLNDMRSLNRADDFFDRYSYALTALSVASGVAFVFIQGAILALFFLASMISLLVIIPISFSISAWADVIRNDIPKVWHPEDVKALTESDDVTN